MIVGDSRRQGRTRGLPRPTPAAIALALVLSIAAAGSARAADPPPLLPVQGFLTDASGTPLTGAHSLRFSLYASASSTTALYTETDASVTVTAGDFVVYLGAAQPIALSLFRDNPTVWIEVVIDGAEIVQPRVQVATAPFAGSAAYCGDASTLGGNAPSAFAQASHTHAFSSLTGIPAGLNQLGALSCTDGQVAKESGGAWTCGTDNDTDTLAGLTCVAGQVASRGASAWGCATLAPVATAGTYSSLIGLPALAPVATTGAFGSLNGVPANLLTGAGTVGYLPMYTGATTEAASVVFQTAQNVGIGTTSPAAPLHVNGAVQWGATSQLTTDQGGSIELGNSGGSATAPHIDFHYGIAASQDYNVRVSNSADGTLLLTANTLRFVQSSASAPNVLLGGNPNSITAGVVGATVSGGGGGDSALAAAGNLVTDDFGTVGGGYQNTAGNDSGTTTDAWMATVAGGYKNVASGTIATVGGGFNNTVSTSGGTIAGGQQNTAGSFAFVGGGQTNFATGGASTVGGGGSNDATGAQATVGGGANNTASGPSATVVGGQANVASGGDATVVGGSGNTAAGNNSLAGGSNAQANANGCFTWGDTSTTQPISCTTANTWLARTTGGVIFVTGVNTGTGAPTAGVQVAAGGGSWSSLSDRNVKKDVTPVDPQAVLAAVDRMPVSTWRYKTEVSGAQHMGPMAQDFRAAFGLGDSDKTITGVDADGVALAAVKGLRELARAQAARVTTLEHENANLRARLDKIEARLGPAPVAAGGARAFGGAGLGLGLGLAGLGLVIVTRRRERGR
jgi:hypothetical protein